MQTRHLRDLSLSALGLGCMGMSEFYGSADERADEAESIRTIHRALDLGVTFIDTADVYGPLKNEVLVGKALRDRRSKVVLATKFGIVRDPNDPGKRGIDGRPEYVRSCVEASLKRLGTDYIDLYYQHRVDPATPIEETVGAMAELVRAGKIRHIGLSEAGTATLERASKVHPITALQSEYSLWSRDVEDEVLPACRKLGIGFVAYSPLGRGFLTGRFKQLSDLAPDDYRHHSPRFQGENFTKNLELVEHVTKLAQRKRCTASQLALAWLLHRGQDIVPIPGTKRVERLEENAGAVAVQLSAAELEEIERIAPKGVAAGTRYPAHMMPLVNR